MASALCCGPPPFKSAMPQAGPAMATVSMEVCTAFPSAISMASATPIGASSSSPQQWTTRACSTLPSDSSASAYGCSSFGDHTPRTSRRAFAGFRSGPSTLKIVRTPSARRTGATCRIAGWKFGANMKAIPAAAMLGEIPSGANMATPSLWRTSALPESDDDDTLPCFATRHPEAAAKMAAVVLMLSVSCPSPPVPTMSTIGPEHGTSPATTASSAIAMCVARSRIARAKPATSVEAAPLRASKASSAATCSEATRPSAMLLQASCA
mmetsp:Transcript_14481/g.54756  ORF Transcript_14481/g.54756 Transcript_14481/m.54756 type:complete len:267 (+) Transcript_14481:308-1108(+)